MAVNIAKLLIISQSKSREVIGLMSGTSLDGLDVAHCRFQNHGPETQIQLLHFTTIPYEMEVKMELRKVVSIPEVNLEQLCNVHAWLGKLHGEMVLQCLRNWKMDAKSIDVIASHGQTVWHSPKPNVQQSRFPNSTLQIGDGDHLAMTTGIITISDFRQKHVAGGGEGAPLALYGDYFLFSMKNENRIMLNIGGIANITCLYGDLDCGKVFATDLGPGNTLIDACVRKYFGHDFDQDSVIGFSGTVHEALLKELKRHPFFMLPFPKTTGAELFNMNYVTRAMTNVGMSVAETNYANIITTLTKFSADIIVDSIRSLENHKSFKIYCSGGGAHNPLLMSEIRKAFPNYVGTTEQLGIPGDAKEAVLFVTLANEALCGDPSKYCFGQQQAATCNKEKPMPNMAMGKVSFPS